MKALEKLFIKKLKDALEIPCPDRIPRTGDKAKDVDCYSVYVTDKRGTYLASEVDGTKLKADLWDEEKQKHSIPKVLYLDKLDELNFEITHYHGVVTHTYTSWLEFTLHEATLMYKLLSPIAIVWSHLKVFFLFRLPQMRFNRKKISEPNREQVLSEIVKLNKINRHQDFEASKLLQNRYGTKVAWHPDYPALVNEWTLILESMKDEGEVTGGPNKFRIKGKAITSLQAIRESNARLKEENARQKRSDRNAAFMVVLTLILAFTALFQSELVETEFKVNLDEVVEYCRSNLVAFSERLFKDG
ncbi:hypothetical protein QNE53_000884 [Vibrio alginolyticus]|nr:hypothetical protein [Vibrio alginolyticus]